MLQAPVDHKEYQDHLQERETLDQLEYRGQLEHKESLVSLQDKAQLVQKVMPEIRVEQRVLQVLLGQQVLKQIQDLRGLLDQRVQLE